MQCSVPTLSPWFCGPDLSGTDVIRWQPQASGPLLWVDHCAESGQLLSEMGFVQIWKPERNIQTTLLGSSCLWSPVSCGWKGTSLLDIYPWLKATSGGKCILLTVSCHSHSHSLHGVCRLNSADFLTAGFGSGCCLVPHRVSSAPSQGDLQVCTGSLE